MESDSAMGSAEQQLTFSITTGPFCGLLVSDDESWNMITKKRKFNLVNSDSQCSTAHDITKSAVQNVSIAWNQSWSTLNIYCFLYYNTNSEFSKIINIVAQYNFYTKIYLTEHVILDVTYIIHCLSSYCVP